MNSETAMNPDDEQRRRLQGAAQRRADPELQQFLRVTFVQPEQAKRQPGADHVIGQQEWNGKAERELGRLEPGPAETAPRKKRPEAQAHVGEERQIKDRRARRRAPNQLLNDNAVLHRLDRNVAERVIGEMQRHINEKNEAGREPDLAKAGHCGSIGAIAAKALARISRRSRRSRAARQCFRRGRGRSPGGRARVKGFGSPSFKSAGALIDAEERS